MSIVKHSSLLHIINESMMVALALTSLYFLVLEATRILTPEQVELIDRIDVTIALIFMTEFFVALQSAKNRYKFIKSRWWELLAAIPLTTNDTSAATVAHGSIIRVARIEHIFCYKE